jgi:bifunctional non-homologous end joining protein LigD
MKRCRWVQPKLVCQVRFSEWTREEKLRQPVFLGIREDKSAREVVREKTSAK